MLFSCSLGFAPAEPAQHCRLVTDERPREKHDQILEEHKCSRLLIIEEGKCRTEEHVIKPAISQEEE